ncbi:MAG: hypothetical protein WAU45_07875 [Blastocatellia bacterium]
MTSRNGSKPRAKPAARVFTGPSTVTGGLARFLPGTRWVEWVRALAGTWGRGFKRSDRLAMVLMRPLTVTRHLRERWLVKSERFHPRINLSVQAILRASGPTVFVRGSSRDIVLADRRARTAAPVESRIEASGYRAADRVPGSIVRIDSASPLERIFTRSESPVEKRETHSSARVEAIIERLTRQPQRIESKVLTSAMTTTRSVNAYSVTQAKALNADSAEAQARIPGVDVFSQPRMDRDPGFEQSRWQRSEPGISIERITDQVIRQLDRRVVAARERMGRTF